MKKIWYKDSVEYYPAIKKYKIMSLAGKWVELEIVVLNEMISSRSQIPHIFTHM
jgi:hypothetical protein